MGKAIGTRNVAVLLVGAMLAAYLSPVLVVCLDGTAPDCCRRSTSGPPSHGEKQLVDGACCDCCIAVDAIPSSIGASTSKSFLDAMAEPAQLRNVLMPSPARAARATARSGHDTRLSSLRTVVLLI